LEGWRIEEVSMVREKKEGRMKKKKEGKDEEKERRKG
jgi:hypothetical protein